MKVRAEINLIISAAITPELLRDLRLALDDAVDDVRADYHERLKLRDITFITEVTP